MSAAFIGDIAWLIAILAAGGIVWVMLGHA